MRPEVNNRRGMTLAEIMVALAMVSIMIVMVVSFVQLMSERTRVSGENLAVQQELSQVESGIEGWMNAMTKARATIAQEKTGETAEGELIYGKLIATVEGENYELTFSYHALKGELVKEGESEGRVITIRTEKVTGITYDLVTKGTGADTEYLLFCIVTVGEADAEETYRFCVNPRVGEQIGGGS